MFLCFEDQFKQTYERQVLSLFCFCFCLCFCFCFCYRLFTFCFAFCFTLRLFVFLIFFIVIRVDMTQFRRLGEESNSNQRRWERKSKNLSESIWIIELLRAFWLLQYKKCQSYLCFCIVYKRSIPIGSISRSKPSRGYYTPSMSVWHFMNCRSCIANVPDAGIFAFHLWVQVLQPPFFRQFDCDKTFVLYCLSVVCIFKHSLLCN